MCPSSACGASARSAVVKSLLGGLTQRTLATKTLYTWPQSCTEGGQARHIECTRGGGKASARMVQCGVSAGVLEIGARAITLRTCHPEGRRREVGTPRLRCTYLEVTSGEGRHEATALQAFSVLVRFVCLSHRCVPDWRPSGTRRASRLRSGTHSTWIQGELATSVHSGKTNACQHEQPRKLGVAPCWECNVACSCFCLLHHDLASDGFDCLPQYLHFPFPFNLPWPSDSISKPIPSRTGRLA